MKWLCPEFGPEVITASVLGKVQKGHTILYFIKDDDFHFENPSATVERLLDRVREKLGMTDLDLGSVSKYLFSHCTSI